MGKLVHPPFKRLLTPAEAAQYCGRGTSPPPIPPKRVRPGRQGLRYDVRDLDAWIDTLEGGALDKDWLAELDKEANEGSRR